MLIPRLVGLAIICFTFCGGCVSAEKKLSPVNVKLRDSEQAKVVPPDKLKEDLDYLFKTIEEVHPHLYAYTSKEEFAPLQEKLYQAIDHSMNHLDFYQLVAPVVASLRFGHTFIWPPLRDFQEYLSKGGLLFPLSVYWHEGNVILANNYGKQELPIGGTIQTINREDASTVFMRYAGYLAAENKNPFPQHLERNSFFWTYMWLEYGPAQSVNVQIKVINNNVSSYDIAFLGEEEVEPNYDPDKGQNTLKYLAGYDTCLARVDNLGDKESFSKFLKEVFTDIRKLQASNLIIDIRNNPGGSAFRVGDILEYLTEKPFKVFDKITMRLSSQACGIPKENNETSESENGFLCDSLRDLPRLLSWQPKPNPLRYSGRVFVMAGPRSTSASTALASAIKHYRIGSLIGQESGDATTFYASTLDFALPNSGLQFTSAFMEMVCVGDKGDGRGVLPDYEVTQKPDDTAKGVDTVLQFTLDLIERSSQ